MTRSDAKRFIDGAKSVLVKRRREVVELENEIREVMHLGTPKEIESMRCWNLEPEICGNYLAEYLLIKKTQRLIGQGNFPQMTTRKSLNDNVCSLPCFAFFVPLNDGRSSKIRALISDRPR